LSAWACLRTSSSKSSARCGTKISSEEEEHGMFAPDEEKNPTEEEEHGVFAPAEEKKPTEEEEHGVFAPDEEKKPPEEEEHGVFAPDEEKKPTEEEGRGGFAPERLLTAGASKFPTAARRRTTKRGLTRELTRTIRAKPSEARSRARVGLEAEEERSPRAHFLLARGLMMIWGPRVRRRGKPGPRRLAKIQRPTNLKGLPLVAIVPGAQDSKRGNRGAGRGEEVKGLR
jgi:hypothetical protein